MVWHDPTTSQLIDLALLEDVGTGDVTTSSCVLPETRAEARVVAKEPLVLAVGRLTRFKRFDLVPRAARCRR